MFLFFFNNTNANYTSLCRLVIDTTTPREKKGRGPTRLSSLITSRISNEKTWISFDQLGNAIGDESKRFSSYVGLLGRSKVSILYDHWNNVPDEAKNCIWECIRVCIIDTIHHFSLFLNIYFDSLH